MILKVQTKTPYHLTWSWTNFVAIILILYRRRIRQQVTFSMSDPLSSEFKCTMNF